MDSNADKATRFGLLLSSIKQETKVFANVAYVRGSEFVSDTKTKLVENGYLGSDYYSGSSPPSSSSSPGVVNMDRQEFTEDKDNSNTFDSVSVPENSDIILYPSYTVHKESFYYVEIRGWVTCPGLMNRKNKIVFSLAKQLIKPGSRNENILDNVVLQTTGHTVGNGDTDSRFKPPQRAQTASTFNDDQFSIRTRNSDNSTTNGNGLEIVDNGIEPTTDEDTLKQRMAYFFARSLPSAPITIKICQSRTSIHEPIVHELVTSEVISDLNGKFETLIRVPYKPSDVEVSIVTTDTRTTISRFQDVILSSDSEISVISDIDDTIKNTQILADKRTLFNNVFIKDIKETCIPGVPELYQFLQAKYNANFHYVSNSPWQLYSTIIRFLNMFSFPIGSIHMKQYTGNIMSSLMEPAAERKKTTLYKLFEEFPNKKFILIGDSGEKDLEAYLDVCLKFPNQVLKICIRVVATSLSDYNDFTILKKLRNIIKLRKERIKIKEEYLKFSNNIESVIDHTKYTRKPPVPPEPRKSEAVILSQQLRLANLTTPDLLDLGDDHTSSVAQLNTKAKPKAVQASKEATAAALIAMNNYSRKPPLPDRPPLPSRPQSRTSNKLNIKVLDKPVLSSKPPLPERSNSSANLISLGDANTSATSEKASPSIPKKPNSIRAKPIRRRETFDTSTPSPSPSPPFSSPSSMKSMRLNPERVPFSKIREEPDMWRAKEDLAEQRLNDGSYNGFNNNDKAAEEPVDRKGEIWIQKLKEMFSVLPDDVDFILWQDPKEIIDACK